MTEETTEETVHGDPSLDHDAHDDAQKGAALGGIGGAVTGAVAGSMAGPVGTLAGAVIGGIVGAVASKAAVGAVDKVEHEILENEAANHPTVLQEPTAHSVAVDPETDPNTLPVPPTDGAATSTMITEDVPEPTEAPGKPA